MEGGVVRGPDRTEWRVEFGEWLSRWGDTKEGHRQDWGGLQLAPETYELKRALNVANEILARSPSPTSAPASR